MIPSRKKGFQKLFLFRKKSSHTVIKNKFYSKSQCFQALFYKVMFINVNFKGAILTKCSFKKAKFSGVDFHGTNVRKSNFSGAKFNRCLFVNALLYEANFKGCTFANCVFVNTNIQRAKNIQLDDSNELLKRYPELEISPSLKDALDQLRDNKYISNSRVLHLKGGKINQLTIKLLSERFSEAELLEKLHAVKAKLAKRVVTSKSLLDFIDTLCVLGYVD